MPENPIKYPLLLPAIPYIFIFIFIFGENSIALPSYRRLWERKYGYTTSCTLCHSKGGGSQVNAYGEDFQRFGMNPAAFVAIEQRDSDKDKSINIDEISAKSNPGDFASNPQSPTDWLSRIEESMLPLDELKKIFPEINKFSVLEGTLYPEQIKEVEKNLNSKLTETDAVPTFYFAVKDQENKPLRTGVAVFATANSNQDKLIVGIGVDLAGKIKNVILIKNKLNKSLDDKKFLDQFKEKTFESALQINKDIQPVSASLTTESAQVIEAVKKSLLIIRIVFNKNKKVFSKEINYEYANFKKNCFSIKCSVDQFIGHRE